MSAVLLGGLAVLIAIISLDWYDVPGGSADTVPAVRFHTLADTADRLDLPWLVPAYFDWLAWILLIAVIIVGMLANTPIPPAQPLRILGLLIGAGGVVVTYYALDQLTKSALDRADAGVWCTLVGFAVAAVGAVIGPRRV
jgi:hypothetical protein